MMPNRNKKELREMIGHSTQLFFCFGNYWLRSTAIGSDKFLNTVDSWSHRTIGLIFTHDINNIWLT